MDTRPNRVLRVSEGERERKGWSGKEQALQMKGIEEQEKGRQRTHCHFVPKWEEEKEEEEEEEEEEGQ